MKKLSALILCVILFITLVTKEGKAQSKRVDSLITKYHRSSIYTLVMEHPGYPFGNEIKQEFFKIPVSNKYNDHNLSVRALLSDDVKTPEECINSFFDRSYVSKRIVSKWFDRSKDSGTFDMNLIWQRGYYDATKMDFQIASKTVRGSAMLADAGEELIGNTYIVVNDIQYIDKEKRAMKTSMWLNLAGGIAGGVAGVSSGNTKDISNSISSLSKSGAEISDLIAGFKVTITSYLYRLEWNENYTTTFYDKYYINKGEVNNEKKLAYENDTNIFKLAYVGKYSVKSSKTVLRGLKSNEEVIRKVCARALDENIVKLQRKYEPFKVKSPINKVQGDTLYSPIGLKEGITSSSKFEVLECYLNENGKTRYKRVGIVKPYKDKIWDNRFMAIEEESAGANLKYTAFKKVSGSNLEPGMLLRQIQ